jgi:hypothetical protein
MKRYVEVTEEHIKFGKKGNPHGCAIALACRADGVASYYIRYGCGETRQAFRFREFDTLGCWIRCFDNEEEKVSPITLCLDDSTMTAYIVPSEARLAESVEEKVKEKVMA